MLVARFDHAVFADIIRSAIQIHDRSSDMCCNKHLHLLPERSIDLESPSITVFADLLCGEQTDALSELQAAKLAVDLIYHLLENIGLPATLKQYGGIAESDLTEAAEMMIEKYPRPENPRPMDRNDAIQFWRNMWEGNLRSE